MTRDANAPRARRRREFDAFASMLARWGPRATGIGDDAAVLDVPAGERLVVSTDASVEDVHFRREWLTPREIGVSRRRPRRSAISPRWRRTPLGVAARARRFRESWRARARRARATASADAVARASARSSAATSPRAERALAHDDGARQHVRAAAARRRARRATRCTSPGRSAARARARRAGCAATRRRATHRAALRAPRAAHRRGALARRRAARRAAIDISDGLARRRGHLAARERRARSSSISTRFRCVDGVSAADAASSGEEYELLVALPRELVARRRARSSARSALPLTAIGRARRDGSEACAQRGERRSALRRPEGLRSLFLRCAPFLAASPRYGSTTHRSSRPIVIVARLLGAAAMAPAASCAAVVHADLGAVDAAWRPA